MVLPKFAYRLPGCRFFRHVGQSFDEFGRYLEEMVCERRELGESSGAVGSAGNVKGRGDLMSALIQASEGSSGDADAEEGKEKEKEAGERTKAQTVKLTDREVAGNIYVFLLAGHGKFPPV